MNALIVIVITVPVAIASFAVFVAQQIIPPGSEWSVVLAMVSMYFAAFGALQTHEGSKISKQIQEVGKEKDQKRKDVVIQYEIPHVLHSLKILKLGMYKTMVLLEAHTVDGKIHTDEGVEHIRCRATMHIEAIRLLGTAFFDAGLSKYHKLLDNVLVNIDEMAFVSKSDTVDITKFKEGVYVVSHMIRTVSNEYNIELQEAGNDQTALHESPRTAAPG